MSNPAQPSTPMYDDNVTRTPILDGTGVTGVIIAVSNKAEKILKIAALEEAIDNEAKQSVQEMHQDRMFVLREQMKFLNETEWRYQPIDVAIGCLAVDSRFQ